MAKLYLTHKGDREFGEMVAEGGYTKTYEARVGLFQTFDNNGGSFEESDLMDLVRDELDEGISNNMVRTALKWMKSKDYVEYKGGN